MAFSLDSILRQRVAASRSSGILIRRVRSIARRTRNGGRALRSRGGRPVLMIIALVVTEVDERSRARLATSRSRHRRVALADQPVPRLIIDNLHLVARIEIGANMGGVLVVIPLVEVDENTPELITIRVGLEHHVDALDGTKAKVLENRADALLTNVLENPGDADAEGCHDEDLRFVFETKAKEVCECTNP